MHFLRAGVDKDVKTKKLQEGIIFLCELTRIVLTLIWIWNILNKEYMVFA